VPCTFYKSEPQPLRGVPFHDRPWLPELAVQVSRQEAERGHESHRCATRSLGSAPVLRTPRPSSNDAYSRTRTHLIAPEKRELAPFRLHGPNNGGIWGVWRGASSDGGKPTPQRPSRSFRYRYRAPSMGKSVHRQAPGDLHPSPRPGHVNGCHAVCGLAHPGERVSVRARVDRHEEYGYKTAPFPRRSPSEPDCLT
jgi:hypothetical protein